MLPIGGASSKDLGFPTYIRVLILLSFVVGGLFLSVSAIMFCSYCVKKIKELRRFAQSTDDDPERGQYRGLLKSLRQNAAEKSQFAQALTSAVSASASASASAAAAAAAAKTQREQVAPILPEKGEIPSVAIAENYIDYAFAKYKESQPDDFSSDQQNHRSPLTSSPNHRDADDDDFHVRSKVIAASSSPPPPFSTSPSPSASFSTSSSPSTVAFRRVDDVSPSRDAHLSQMDAGIGQRRHVSFELRGGKQTIATEAPGQRLSRNSAERLPTLPKGSSSSATILHPTPTASTRQGDRPPPSGGSRGSRPRCQTMDPTVYHRPPPKSFAIKADIHRGRTTPDFEDERMGAQGPRDSWIAMALENRKLLVDEMEGPPYWNSLEFQSDRKMEGCVARLVNSYDEQIIRPSKPLAYHDPLRITEFLNGPCGDEEIRGKDLNVQFAPKRVKVFEVGTSFDQNDLEPEWCGAGNTTSSHEGQLKLSRLDSITSRTDSVFTPRKRSVGGIFRGIAMSRTIDVPDRVLGRSFEGQRVMKKWKPVVDVALGKSNEPGSKGDNPPPTKDSQSIRRQVYGHAFAKCSRRQGGSAEGNSFDSVDASESSHCEVTTTSMESSTTTASTDSQSDAKSSHKLHQMRDDSGYKSLEQQQSLGKTGTRSLDVQVHRTRLAELVALDAKVIGQSLDSQIIPVRGSEGLGSLKTSPMGMKCVTERKNLEQEPGVSIQRLAATSGNETGSLAEAEVDQHKRGFLAVPIFEGGFKVSLTKAKSQDFASSEAGSTGASASSSSVPSSASSIFPLSFEKLLHRAEHYLSNAVSQAAENLLSMGNTREDTSKPRTTTTTTTDEALPPGTSPSPESTTSFATTMVTQPPPPPPPGNDRFEPPSATKEGERSSDTDSGSRPLLQTYRQGTRVVLPVWSQLLAEKEGKCIRGEERTTIPIVLDPLAAPLNPAIGVIRRGDLRTASKKRREWRSRRQLTEVNDSSALDSPKDHALPPSSGAAPPTTGETVYLGDLQRSLTTLDYSIDETTFDDLVDDGAKSRVGHVTGYMGHDLEMCDVKQLRSVRKMANPELRRPTSGLGQGQIQSQGVIATKPTRFSCYSSIAEEAHPLESDS